MTKISIKPFCPTSVRVCVCHTSFYICLLQLFGKDQLCWEPGSGTGCGSWGHPSAPCGWKALHYIIYIERGLSRDICDHVWVCACTDSIEHDAIEPPLPSSKTKRRTWSTSTKLLGKHGLVALAVEAVTQGIVLVRVVRLKLGISWGMGRHHVPKPPGDTSKFQTSIACGLTCQERLAGHHSIFWWYPKAWPISIKQACHMCHLWPPPLLTVEAQLRELVQKPGQGALSRWMSTEEFLPYFRAKGTHGMEVFLIGKIWQDSTTIRHWEP